jgi:hypothetical protein
MLMFFSPSPSMAGRWLELEEKKATNTILVTDFHQCEAVREVHWQRADSDQFVNAVRGKCVDFFFGDGSS